MKFDAEDAKLLRPIKITLSPQKFLEMTAYLRDTYIDFLLNKPWYSSKSYVDLVTQDGLKSGFKQYLQFLNEQIGKHIKFAITTDRQIELHRYESRDYKSVINELSHLLIINNSTKPMNVQIETQKYVDKVTIEKNVIILDQYELLLIKPHSYIKILDSSKQNFFIVKIDPVYKVSGWLQEPMYDKYLLEGKHSNKNNTLNVRRNSTKTPKTNSR